MLKQGIVGIVDLIATPSLINLDFADVNTVMRNQGLAHMGIGRAKGESRVIESVRQAVSSPLLETTIEGARSVILNVTGGKDLLLSEVNEAAVLVQGIIDASANIIFGATIDDSMVDEVKITVIATGFNPLSDEEKTVAEEPAAKPVEQTGKSAVPPLLRMTEAVKEPQRTAQAQPAGVSAKPAVGQQGQSLHVQQIWEVRHTEEPAAPARAAEKQPVAPAVPVQTAEPAAPVRDAAEQPARQDEKKGKELPAFMRKLFGKK